eukprot:GEMP01052289.1.p1 GENE.GEMP01052289.1~~GEMP01052289.1.p1  ORF type:complete len:300 (+),score=62.29 GEMP01052289.1:59-958(+)
MCTVYISNTQKNMPLTNPRDTFVSHMIPDTPFPFELVQEEAFVLSCEDSKKIRKSVVEECALAEAARTTEEHTSIEKTEEIQAKNRQRHLLTEWAFRCGWNAIYRGLEGHARDDTLVCGALLIGNYRMPYFNRANDFYDGYLFHIKVLEAPDGARLPVGITAAPPESCAMQKRSFIYELPDIACVVPQSQAIIDQSQWRYYDRSKKSWRMAIKAGDNVCVIVVPGKGSQAEVYDVIIFINEEQQLRWKTTIRPQVMDGRVMFYPVVDATGGIRVRLCTSASPPPVPLRLRTKLASCKRT